MYEEHILQICEDFAGVTAGRADVLRRALVKQKQDVIAVMRDEFFVSAAAKVLSLNNRRSSVVSMTLSTRAKKYLTSKLSSDVIIRFLPI